MFKNAQACPWSWSPPHPSGPLWSCLKNGQWETFLGNILKLELRKVNQSLHFQNLRYKACDVSAPCFPAGFQKGGSRFAKRKRKQSCRMRERAWRCLNVCGSTLYRELPKYFPVPAFHEIQPFPRLTMHNFHLKSPV